MADKAEKTSPPDGVIRFEVDKISTLTLDVRCSPDFEVKGVPWCVSVMRGDNLYPSLECKIHQSKQWSIDVDAEFILVHSDNNKNIAIESSENLNNTNDYVIGGALLNWKTLIDNVKGFINDDKITVECHFWIYNMRGIRTVPLINFTEPNEPFHDVALVINGEKIYVSKQILAAHSSFFKAMFYGEFAERNKDEIEMKDIDKEEFVGLLHVIYSSGKAITNDSAKYLLKLGDRFQIVSVIDRVEEFLISSTKISDTEKMRIADQYRLFDLLKHCITALDKKEDFNKVKNSPIYNALSNDTKALLFEQLLNLPN